MTDDSPGARADAAKASLAVEEEALEANLAAIAARLKAVRKQEADIYAELEEAVVEAEPRLGATRTMRAAGLSRARVYQIIPKKGQGAGSPKGVE
jgi:hypothetical protein